MSRTPAGRSRPLDPRHGQPGDRLAANPAASATESAWAPLLAELAPGAAATGVARPCCPRRVLERLRGLPPLVFAGEARALLAALGEVCEGRAFLLQAGDCVESFHDASAPAIRERLKVMLQMSAVLTYGAMLPVVRVGRIAGQFAKPRSEPTEVVDGVDLPSFRGHVVHSDEPTPEARVARSGADGAGLLPGGLHTEPAACVHEGRVRRPDARAHVEPRVRRSLAGGSALRGPRRRDRAGAPFHAGDRDRSRRRAHAPRGRRLDEPRGAAPRVRGGSHAHRFADRAAVRLLGAHALDRRTHA